MHASMILALLQEVDTDIEDLKNRLEGVKEDSSKLADMFCEDNKNFKLEELLQIFRTFCDKIGQCLKVR